MASVFVSYKRENLAAVRPVVEALRGAGLEVWWDQDIAPNVQWEATIERELNAAKVVIVAWSRAAVNSESVKAEARRARVAGKLIQIFVEDCEPPLFFGERQGVDLTRWNGDANESRFQAILSAARAIAEGKAPPKGVGYTAKRRSPWGAVAALFVGVSAALGLVANLGGARDAVCGLTGLLASCQRAGLVAAPANPHAEREALLRRVEGVWGNPTRADAPACTLMFRYSLSHRGDEDYIILRGENGNEHWESVGRVASAEGDSIFTRTITPASEAGTQWELRLEADRLIQVDNVNTPTPLVRCAD